MTNEAPLISNKSRPNLDFFHQRCLTIWVVAIVQVFLENFRGDWSRIMLKVFRMINDIWLFLAIFEIENDPLRNKKIPILASMIRTKSLVSGFMANMDIFWFEIKTSREKFEIALIAFIRRLNKFRLWFINKLALHVLMPIHLSIFALKDSSATFVSIYASELQACYKFVQCGAHIEPLRIRFIAEAALVTYFEHTSFAKNSIFTRVALLWLLIWG